MKDKEKQTEEMAKDIYEQKSCDTSFEENCKLLAYDLVTLGYQKVDKDSIMLSREEYKTLLDNAIRLDMEYLEHEKAKVRKKTAREILHKIYEELSKYEAVNEIDYDCWVDDVLYEIAKQYGVEIKELNL